MDEGSSKTNSGWIWIYSPLTCRSSSVRLCRWDGGQLLILRNVSVEIQRCQQWAACAFISSSSMSSVHACPQSQALADPGTIEHHRPDVIQLEALNKKRPDQPSVKRGREDEYPNVCLIFQLPRCRVLTATEKVFPEAVCPDTIQRFSAADERLSGIKKHISWQSEWRYSG